MDRHTDIFEPSAFARVSPTSDYSEIKVTVWCLERPDLKQGEWEIS